MEQLGPIRWKYSDPTRRIRSSVVSATRHYCLRAIAAISNLCAVDQPGDLKSDSCWLGVGNQLSLDLIHLRHIIQVGDVDRDGDDVSHLEARLFRNLLYRGDGVRSL